MTPFFSIVIPTYNRLEFLKLALESISHQEFDNYEIIVVNDGSTDGTLEFLEAESASNENLLPIHQENAERGAARNSGWKKAKGSYVVFFDSDDLMHPNYLEELRKAIQKTNAEIVCGKIVIQDELGRIKKHIDQKGLSGINNFKLFLKGNPIACHFAVKNDMNDFKPFIEDRGLASMEDWLFLIDNTINKQVCIIDKDLVTMKTHSEQSMKQDRIIVERKLLAISYIEKHIAISKADLQLLKGYAYENIGIHLINSRDIKIALSMFWKALMIKGLSLKMIYNTLRIGQVFMKNDSK